MSPPKVGPFLIPVQNLTGKAEIGRKKLKHIFFTCEKSLYFVLWIKSGACGEDLASDNISCVYVGERAGEEEFIFSSPSVSPPLRAGNNYAGH